MSQYNTQTAIDAVVTDWLALPLTDPNVATDWRPLIRRKMQEVVGIDLWLFRQWRWKRKKTTVVLTNGVGPIPADFSKVGPRGGVWVTGQQRKLRYADSERVLNEQQLYSNASGIPEFYSLDGTDFIVEVLTSSYTLYVSYEKKAPTLVDQGTAGHNLDAIPDEFHEAIIMGTIDKLSVPQGDGRGATELSPRFRKALSDLAANEVDGDDELEQMGDYGYSQLGMW